MNSSILVSSRAEGCGWALGLRTGCSILGCAAMQVHIASSLPLSSTIEQGQNAARLCSPAHRGGHASRAAQRVKKRLAALINLCSRFPHTEVNPVNRESICAWDKGKERGEKHGPGQ